jgi:hypothetical protein
MPQWASEICGNRQRVFCHSRAGFPWQTFCFLRFAYATARSVAKTPQDDVKFTHFRELFVCVNKRIAALFWGIVGKIYPTPYPISYQWVASTASISVYAALVTLCRQSSATYPCRSGGMNINEIPHGDVDDGVTVHRRRRSILYRTTTRAHSLRMLGTHTPDCQPCHLHPCLFPHYPQVS